MHMWWVVVHTINNSEKTTRLIRGQGRVPSAMEGGRHGAMQISLWISSPRCWVLILSRNFHPVCCLSYKMGGGGGGDLWILQIRVIGENLPVGKSNSKHFSPHIVALNIQWERMERKQHFKRATSYTALETPVTAFKENASWPPAAAARCWLPSEPAAWGSAESVLLGLGRSEQPVSGTQWICPPPF